MDSVVVLPANPLVSRVACTVDTLTVAVVDAAASESWLPGHHGQRSAHRGCARTRVMTRRSHSPAHHYDGGRKCAWLPSSRAHASFHYDDATDFSEGGYTYAPSFAGRAATFVFRTAPVPAHAAFKHLHFFGTCAPRRYALWSCLPICRRRMRRSQTSCVPPGRHAARRGRVQQQRHGVPLHVALARRLGISDDHARRLWWNPISPSAAP